MLESLKTFVAVLEAILQVPETLQGVLRRLEDLEEVVGAERC